MDGSPWARWGGREKPCTTEPRRGGVDVGVVSGGGGGGGGGRPLVLRAVFVALVSALLSLAYCNLDARHLKASEVSDHAGLTLIYTTTGLSIASSTVPYLHSHRRRLLAEVGGGLYTAAELWTALMILHLCVFAPGAPNPLPLNPPSQHAVRSVQGGDGAVGLTRGLGLSAQQGGPPISVQLGGGQQRRRRRPDARRGERRVERRMLLARKGCEPCEKRFEPKASRTLCGERVCAGLSWRTLF